MIATVTPINAAKSAVKHDHKTHSRGQCDDYFGREADRLYQQAKRARLAMRSEKQRLADMLAAHPDGRKLCRTCRKVKSLGDFSHSISRWDDLQDSCKVCYRESQKRAKKLDKTKPCPARCGGKVGTFDHFIASSNGGANQDDNLIGLCRRCNHEKARQDPFVFFASRGVDVLTHPAFAHLAAVQERLAEQVLIAA